MSIVLQDPRFVVVSAVDTGTDITHRDSENALPGRALCRGVRPLLCDSGLRTLVGGDVVVVVPGDFVGVERGVDDVLDCNGGPIALAKLIGAGRGRHPAPLVGGEGDDIVLLPPVEVPGLTVTADAVALGPAADALIVAAGAAAQDEDFLLAVELVDGLAHKEAVHGVGDGVFVNAGVVDEGTAAEVVSEVAATLVVLAVHEDVVGGGEGFDGAHDDLSQDAAEVGGLFECVVYTDGWVS